MNRVTLKDVADHVAVSAKTVSNVVNGTGCVSDHLKARVRHAIDELGYRPNAAARQLRSGRSGMIAVALPDLAQPYFAELASALVRAAEARSVTVLISQTGGQADAERRISDGVGVPVMDGLILSPLALTAEDLANRIDATPVVLLGEHIGASPFPHVAVDSIQAARAATEHLIASGRRRIAAIGSQTGKATETADLRLKGYRSALEAAGLALDPSLIRPVEQFVRADGAAAAAALLDDHAHFDAVFAFNDLLALGAMHEFVERGIRIPDDAAVMGFDDIEEARYSSPSLSTVAPDTDAIARRALDLLLNETCTDRCDLGVQPIPFQIVKRAST